jgi:hypothetical protein
MILEVDDYNNLETLAADITDVASVQDYGQFTQMKPLKVEMSKKNYDKVMHDLKSYGTYAGARNETELKSATWKVGGAYVSFIIKKEE